MSVQITFVLKIIITYQAKLRNYYNNNKHLSIEGNAELELVGENFKTVLFLKQDFIMNVFM